MVGDKNSILSGEEILKIKHPEILFKEPDQIDQIFIKLAHRWHPDKCKEKNAGEVFKHINKLRKLAKEKVKENIWDYPNLLILKIKGKIIRFKYLTQHEINVGKMYVGNSLVMFVIDQDKKDLYLNGFKNINKFKFYSEDMKNEMIKYLPQIEKSFSTDDNKYVLILKKTPDVFVLKDILNYFKGKIDPVHVAWILNSLYNIACYLNYAKLVHNDFSQTSIFLSPKYHSGLLLGGWWFSSDIGSKIELIPKRTKELLPTRIIKEKTYDSIIDLELIKQIGRELLGDPTGIKLRTMKIPLPICEYLLMPSTSNPVDEYKNWGEILTEVFGKRKFVKMDIEKKDLYERVE